MCQASKQMNIAKKNTVINMSMKQSLSYMKTETRELYSAKCIVDIELHHSQVMSVFLCHRV